MVRNGLADEEQMEAFIKKTAVGVWHASCTCRMGADDDPMAVTDNQGRVRGVVLGGTPSSSLISVSTYASLR